MSTEQVTFPTAELIEHIIIDVFWRRADQQAITDLFGVFVLSPPVTALAKWYLIPLLGFVIIAGLGELLPVPDILDALFEDVSHVGRAHAIQAAKPNAAIIVNRH